MALTVGMVTLDMLWVEEKKSCLLASQQGPTHLGAPSWTNPFDFSGVGSEDPVGESCLNCLPTPASVAGCWSGQGGPGVLMRPHPLFSATLVAAASVRQCYSCCIQGLPVRTSGWSTWHPASRPRWKPQVQGCDPEGRGTHRRCSGNHIKLVWVACRAPPLFFSAQTGLGLSAWLLLQMMALAGVRW